MRRARSRLMPLLPRRICRRFSPPRESDVVDKGIDRKLRFSDDLFEVFPVFEVAFAVGFVSMAS